MKNYFLVERAKMTSVYLPEAEAQRLSKISSYIEGYLRFNPTEKDINLPIDVHIDEKDLSTLLKFFVKGKGFSKPTLTDIYNFYQYLGLKDVTINFPIKLEKDILSYSVGELEFYLKMFPEKFNKIHKKIQKLSSKKLVELYNRWMYYEVVKVIDDEEEATEAYKLTNLVLDSTVFGASIQPIEIKSPQEHKKRDMTYETLLLLTSLQARYLYMKKNIKTMNYLHGHEWEETATSKKLEIYEEKGLDFYYEEKKFSLSFESFSKFIKDEDVTLRVLKVLESPHVCLAGGCLTTMLLGRDNDNPYSDVDLWVLDSTKIKDILDILTNGKDYSILQRKHASSDKASVLTIVYHNKTLIAPVQIVYSGESSFQDIVDNFDFTHLYVYYYQGKVFSSPLATLGLMKMFSYDVSIQLDKTAYYEISRATKISDLGFTVLTKGEYFMKKQEEQSYALENKGTITYNDVLWHLRNKGYETYDSEIGFQPLRIIYTMKQALNFGGEKLFYLPLACYNYDNKKEQFEIDINIYEGNTFFVDYLNNKKKIKVINQGENSEEMVQVKTGSNGVRKTTISIFNLDDESDDKSDDDPNQWTYTKFNNTRAYKKNIGVLHITANRNLSRKTFYDPNKHKDVEFCSLCESYFYARALVYFGFNDILYIRDFSLSGFR
jgi:hypothetical protein